VRRQRRQPRLSGLGLHAAVLRELRRRARQRLRGRPAQQHAELRQLRQRLRRTSERAQRGKFVTSHYAIGTGLGALFITFATILAGIVQSVFGYKGVFIAACLLTIPGALTLLFIPMDEEETKKVKAAGDH
jgi:hypothetical protein